MKRLRFALLYIIEASTFVRPGFNLRIWARIVREAFMD